MSEECVFKCLCCELVSSKSKMDNFSARPASLVQKLRSEGYKGQIYVYNIMVCEKSMKEIDWIRWKARVNMWACWVILKFLRIWTRLLRMWMLYGKHIWRRTRNTEMTDWRWLLDVQRYPFSFNVEFVGFPSFLRSLVCYKTNRKRSHYHWPQASSKDLPRRRIYRANDWCDGW